MSESINNKLTLLMNTFIELTNSTRIDIILNTSFIEVVNMFIRPYYMTNVIYIFDNIKLEKVLQYTEISLQLDNKLFLKLLRKRNKFKNRLIDILEKEILKENLNV